MVFRSLFFCLLILLPLPAAAQEQKKPPQGPPPALVVTAPVTEDTVRPPLTLVGTAEPRYRAAVAAEVPGWVESLEAREGEKVAEGAPLARLRTLPVELELRQTRAQLAETRARLEKARDDVRRAENLFDQGFISAEELQARRTDRKVLQEQAAGFQAAIVRLQDRLGRMMIEAPFAGRVVEEQTERGQWLAVGDPVVVLADLSVVKIRVPVPEQSISGITLGEEAAVHFDALPDLDATGRVAAIVPQADVAARTFPVEVDVANPEGRILAGMLAQVSFFIGEPRRALLVPKDALVPQPGGEGMLIKVADGKAVQVPVRIIASYRDRFAVESLGGELSGGDKVVVRGNERVRPGQPVREAAP